MINFVDLIIEDIGTKVDSKMWDKLSKIKKGNKLSISFLGVDNKKKKWSLIAKEKASITKSGNILDINVSDVNASSKTFNNYEIKMDKKTSKVWFWAKMGMMPNRTDKKIYKIEVR